jgi:hypothetical protein
VDPSNNSSSGDVGNRYGNKLGANVATSQEMMLASAANKMSGSCPKIVRFLVSLFNIVGGEEKRDNTERFFCRGVVFLVSSGGPSSSSPFNYSSVRN